ncbi:MAG: endonuclease domain-containing protein [Alphaproteobacteria bacterium]|nr:endonuclease domain-containing protein [Alphaproteobacteria bacterium]MBV8412347.1 endonuclease domain-containing protein [Alphaproteobacteria bacterium]
MLRRARTLRKSPTDAEYLLWKHLRSRKLSGFKFRRQHSVGPYICDFACLEGGMVVELDGSQHVEQSDYDERRDSFLRSRGFRVIRFWNNDVLVRTESVLETIFEALHRREMDGRFD